MDEQTTPPPSDAPPPPPPEAVNEPPPSPSASRRARKRADPVSGPSDPPPPFAGGPVEERAPNPAAQKAAKISTKANAALAVVDPTATAEQLVRVADSLIGALIDSRYGEMVDANTGKRVVDVLAVTPAERENMAKALALVLQQSVGGMSPIAALAISFGATYGARVAMMEPALAKAKRARKQAA